MFKGMKASVREGETPNASVYQICHYLEIKLKKLFNSNDDTLVNLVNLPSHKKNTIASKC